MGGFLRWQLDHPIDTPALQKIATSYLSKLTDLTKVCPIPDSLKIFSEGQRLTSGINTFLGVGIAGLIYAAFM